MKYRLVILALLSSLVFSGTAFAQNNKIVEYKTFIYTDSTLPDEIREANGLQDESTRGFASDLLGATLNAAKGIGAGYITSLVDFGVGTVANLISQNKKNKKEWEDMVAAENKWTTSIGSTQNVRDFYQKPSHAGALDPMDMQFNGIGCLRMEGPDTVFYISCHIDRSKLDRIINHSKFELVLDTLIINPTRSNLPNTSLPIGFNFQDRKDFALAMNMKVSSSWFTEIIDHHDDEILGEFNLTVPVSPEDLNSKGEFRYVRTSDEPSKYQILGECFIIPRSFMGYRDKDGKYNRIWGTGQYKLDITLTETCDITDAYRKNWKKDRKYRNSFKPKEGFFPSLWKTVSSQKWDEITKSWVITTLSAPAHVLSNEVIKQAGLSTSPTNAGAAQGNAASGNPSAKKP